MESHQDNIIKGFRHKVSSRVQYYEVDTFEVVHNIRYLYWLEWARLEYLRSIGWDVDSRTVTYDLPLMVVHSEIDYLNSLQFDDVYHVFSRVAKINNSSLEFENVILNDKSEPIVKAKAVLVYLNRQTKQSDRIPDKLRELIQNYEANNPVSV